MDSAPASEAGLVPIWLQKFTVTLLQLHGPTTQSFLCKAFWRVSITDGHRTICTPMQGRPLQDSSEFVKNGRSTLGNPPVNIASWKEKFKFFIKIYQLPLNSRLLLELISPSRSSPQSDEDLLVPLASAEMPLFDAKEPRAFRGGSHSLCLTWNFQKDGELINRLSMSAEAPNISRNVGSNLLKRQALNSSTENHYIIDISLPEIYTPKPIYNSAQPLNTLTGFSPAPTVEPNVTSHRLTAINHHPILDRPLHELALSTMVDHDQLARIWGDLNRIQEREEHLPSFILLFEKFADSGVHLVQVPDIDLVLSNEDIIAAIDGFAQIKLKTFLELVFVIGKVRSEKLLLNLLIHRFIPSLGNTSQFQWLKSKTVCNLDQFWIENAPSILTLYDTYATHPSISGGPHANSDLCRANLYTVILDLCERLPSIGQRLFWELVPDRFSGPEHRVKLLNGLVEKLKSVKSEFIQHSTDTNTQTIDSAAALLLYQESFCRGLVSSLSQRSEFQRDPLGIDIHKVNENESSPSASNSGHPLVEFPESPSLGNIIDLYYDDMQESQVDSESNIQALPEHLYPHDLYLRLNRSACDTRSLQLHMKSSRMRSFNRNIWKEYVSIRILGTPAYQRMIDIPPLPWGPRSRHLRDGRSLREAESNGREPSCSYGIDPRAVHVFSSSDMPVLLAIQRLEDTPPDSPIPDESISNEVDIESFSRAPHTSGQDPICANPGRVLREAVSNPSRSPSRDATLILIKADGDVRPDAYVSRLLCVISSIWNADLASISLDMCDMLECLANGAAYREGDDCCAMCRMTAEALALQTYRVQPLAPKGGIVEYVADAVPLSQLNSRGAGSEGSAFQKLKRLGYTDGSLKADLGGAEGQVRLIGTAAAYTVATYVLGIGDRHCDNVVLCVEDSALMHVDYNYLWSSDPKPFAPAMRISSELISLLRGIDGGLLRYRALCASIFCSLRRNPGDLIAAMLSVPPAQAHQLAGACDSGWRGAALAAKFVHERLLVTSTDYAAMDGILGLLDASLCSYAPAILDAMHRVAQYLRL